MPRWPAPRSSPESLIVRLLSLLATTMKRMADSKLWTAEELERLSPAERTEIIRAGIVTDREDVPHAFLDRVRANVHDNISTSESAAALPWKRQAQEAVTIQTYGIFD